MDLSIVIVNWNTSSLLKQCLQSIYDHTTGLTFEVIVIDNGSSDDSVPMVRQYFPQIQLIENNQNLGFASANNQGLAISQGRYYLLLNSDTVVCPSSLPTMVRIADHYPEVGVLGCKLLNADGSLQESWASFPTLWSELLGRNFRQRRLISKTPALYAVDWVGGACLLVRAAAVEQVGFLDETFFMYSEETDWCFRIKQQGWKVYYLAGAAVVHFGGGSAGRTSFIQLVRLYESKIRFFQKHYGTRQAVLLRYGLAVATGLGLMGQSLHWSLDSRRRSQLGPRLKIQRQLVRRLVRGPAIIP